MDRNSPFVVELPKVHWPYRNIACPAAGEALVLKALNSWAASVGIKLDADGFPEPEADEQGEAFSAARPEIQPPEAGPAITAGGQQPLLDAAVTETKVLATAP